MTTEPNRVSLRLSDDPRLLGGVAGAVKHFAQRAGLDEAAQRDLIEATHQACQTTFPLLPDGDHTLVVAIEDFSDRVEITLEHHGEALPSAGLETFAGFGGEGEQPGDLSGIALMSRVDRVLYDTQGDTSRMTLVKYTSAATQK